MAVVDDAVQMIEIAREVTRSEVAARRLVDEARAQADQLVMEHATEIERVAYALMSQRELSGADVGRLIEMGAS